MKVFFSKNTYFSDLQVYFIIYFIIFLFIDLITYLNRDIILSGLNNLNGQLCIRIKFLWEIIRSILLDLLLCNRYNRAHNTHGYYGAIMRGEMISSGGRVNADRFISFSFSDRRNTNQSSAASLSFLFHWHPSLF